MLRGRGTLAQAHGQQLPRTSASEDWDRPLAEPGVHRAAPFALVLHCPRHPVEGERRCCLQCQWLARTVRNPTAPVLDPWEAPSAPWVQEAEPPRLTRSPPPNALSQNQGGARNQRKRPSDNRGSVRHHRLWKATKRWRPTDGVACDAQADQGLGGPVEAARGT